MHNSMKATIKLSAAAVQDADCRHAARHGLQSPGSITPQSAAEHCSTRVTQPVCSTAEEHQDQTEIAPCSTVCSMIRY